MDIGSCNSEMVKRGLPAAGPYAARVPARQPNFDPPGRKKAAFIIIVMTDRQWLPAAFRTAICTVLSWVVVGASVRRGPGPGPVKSHSDSDPNLIRAGPGLVTRTAAGRTARPARPRRRAGHELRCLKRITGMAARPGSRHGSSSITESGPPGPSS